MKIFVKFFPGDVIDMATRAKLEMKASSRNNLNGTCENTHFVFLHVVLSKINITAIGKTCMLYRGCLMCPYEIRVIIVCVVFVFAAALLTLSFPSIQRFLFSPPLKKTAKEFRKYSIDLQYILNYSSYTCTKTLKYPWYVHDVVVCITLYIYSH